MRLLDEPSLFSIWGRSGGTREKWCRCRDLNPGPSGYEPLALTSLSYTGIPRARGNAPLYQPVARAPLHSGGYVISIASP